MKLAKNESMNGLPLPDLDTSLSMKLKGEQRFYSIKHGNRPLRVDLCAELVNREEQLKASLLRERELTKEIESLRGLLSSALDLYEDQMGPRFRLEVEAAVIGGNKMTCPFPLHNPLRQKDGTFKCSGCDKTWDEYPTVKVTYPKGKR